MPFQEKKKRCLNNVSLCLQCAAVLDGNKLKSNKYQLRFDIRGVKGWQIITSNRGSCSVFLWVLWPLSLCLVGLFSNPFIPLLHFTAKENLPGSGFLSLFFLKQWMHCLFIWNNTGFITAGSSINQNKCYFGKISCIPSLLAHQQRWGAGERTAWNTKCPILGQCDTEK